MEKKNDTPNSTGKSKGVRALLIHGMTRDQQIAFIKRKDIFYSGASFAGHSDEQVRNLALSVDRTTQGKKHNS